VEGKCDELAEKFEKMTKLINGHNEWELERPESTTPRVRLDFCYYAQ